MTGEVGVVLDVERCEWTPSGETAETGQRVVDRSRAAAEPGVSLDLVPDGGGMEAARQDDDTGEEGAQAGGASWFPAMQVPPLLGQLADGDER